MCGRTGQAEVSSPVTRIKRFLHALLLVEMTMSVERSRALDYARKDKKAALENSKAERRYGSKRTLGGDWVFIL